MTSSQVTLESFDDGTDTPPRQSAEFKRGFEAGVAAMQEAESARQTDAVSAISSTLGDMQFGYAEARIALLDRIRPLLVQVAEAVLPQVAQESFAAHLVEVLARDFETQLGEPVHITVTPNALCLLKDHFEDLSQNFVFASDPCLTDGQALLRNPTHQIIIDLPALMQSLQTALGGLEPLERMQSNG